MMRLLTGALSLAWVAAGSGCQSTVGRDDSAIATRFFLESAQTDGVPIILPQSGVRLSVNSKPVITEGDIVNVELVQVDLGKCLLIQLTPPAARDFHRLSVAHQGRRLVMMVKDQPIGARRIDGAISDGMVYLFVEMPDGDLPGLVHHLKKSSVALQRELARQE